MSKIVKPVSDRAKENVVAALDAAEGGLQAMTKGLGVAKRRIEDLEELLASSEEARLAAERKATEMQEKLRKVQATLA